MSQEHPIPNYPRFKNLTGKKFHKYTVIEYRGQRYGAMWLCRCDCGTLREVVGTNLVSGNSRSCGCIKPPSEDLTGRKFGRLVAMNYSGSCPSGALWNCVCECGKSKTASACHLKSGHTKSCGCFQAERRVQTHRTHGKSNTSIHAVWKGMLRRCDLPTVRAYPRYGGRGIAVCERWKKFQNFYADMGERPEGKSLERINNDGGYSPDNCRWATQKEQARNRRSSSAITFLGKTLTIAEWAERLGKPYSDIFYRARHGLPLDYVGPQRRGD